MSDDLLKLVGYEDKAILTRFLELYLCDLSAFDPQLRPDVHGLFGYRYLDHYWTEPGRYPYFIRFNDELIGFVR